MAVLCETELVNPAAGGTLFEAPLHWVAAGEPKKAVAIVSPARLDPLPPRSTGRRWSAAASSSEGPTVVGIHSLPAGGSGRHYEDEVMACLLDWADHISGGDVIVAGDFNIGPDLTRPGKNSWLERAVALWSELGLVSAYHHFYDEGLLTPSRPTHYWRYKREAAWHIDYVLVHRSRIEQVRGVFIGGFDEWVATGSLCRSDHVPLIVDVDWV